MVSYVRGKTGGPKLSDDQIAAAYAEGEDSVSIALRANVDSTTVLKIARAAGVPIRPRGRGKRKTLGLTDADICRLYEAGVSGPVIADRAGTTTNTVYNILRRGGIPLRTSGAVSSAMAAASRARRYPRKEPP